MKGGPTTRTDFLTTAGSVALAAVPLAAAGLAPPGAPGLPGCFGTWESDLAFWSVTTMSPLSSKRKYAVPVLP